MMVMPSKKERKLIEIVSPYIDYSKNDSLVLIDTAPKEIKKKFEKLIDLQRKQQCNPNWG